MRISPGAKSQAPTLVVLRRHLQTKNASEDETSRRLALEVEELAFRVREKLGSLGVVKGKREVIFLGKSTSVFFSGFLEFSWFRRTSDTFWFCFLKFFYVFLGFFANFW